MDKPSELYNEIYNDITYLVSDEYILGEKSLHGIDSSVERIGKSGDSSISTKTDFNRLNLTACLT